MQKSTIYYLIGIAIAIIILIIIGVLVFQPEGKPEEEKKTGPSTTSPSTQEKIPPLEEQKGYEPPVQSDVPPLEETGGYEPPVRSDVPPL